MSESIPIEARAGVVKYRMVNGLGTRDLPYKPVNDVYIQDQTTDIIDLHLTRFIDDITITSNTSIDDVDVEISCATAPVSGNTVCFKESYAFYQGGVLSVTDNGGGQYSITLDTPLDFAYTTAGGCSLRDENMNVDGSTTPVVFYVSPKGLFDQTHTSDPQRWDIVRLMIFIGDTTAMDDARFGGIDGGLTNGVVIRKKDGTYKNIFNAKTNGDFALHSYDAAYVDNTLGPSGEYGLRVRRTFGGQSKNGAVIRLDSATDDEIQLIVRDDLTGLTRFYAVVQGHVVD